MRFSAMWMALLCACGPGLSDLTLEAAPVARVRAKVDLGGIRATGYEGDLLVGFLWATAEQMPRACRAYAHLPEIAALPQCSGQSLSVKLRQPFPSMAPLEADADGLAELVMKTLPDTRLSSGNARGRVFYGSIVVATDVDANGVFEPWGSMNSDGGEGTQPDRIVAASFTSLRRPHERLVLREGAWNPLSLFFPTFGCETPPPGFSRLASTLDLSGEHPSGQCEITGVNEVFNVPVLSDEAVEEMGCTSWLGVSEPRHFNYSLEGTGVCLSEDLYFEAGGDDRACANSTLVPLSGCHDDGGPCDEPHWDFTDNPPDWWPCK